MKYVTGMKRSVVFFLLICVESLSRAQDAEFYCQKDTVVDINNFSRGRIITRKNGDTHYDNSLHCTWIIQADSSDNRQTIQISVLESHLQWAPVDAICVGYDYVIIRDGNSSSSPELLTWCGDKNPHSITSTGSSLYVEFYTNDRNQYAQKGVKLEFGIFERSMTKDGCPPGWFDDPDLPGGGDSCYMLKTHPETWTMAQTYCSYDQANLVTISTLKEEQVLTDFISSSNSIGKYDKVWISLNDIKVDGEYKWLDGTAMTFTKWEEPNHSVQSYYNCIQMNKDGFWQEDFCNENDIQSVVKHMFICKKQKVGRTEIYTLPAERISKGGKETTTPHHTWIILAILFACIVVAIIIIVSLVCYCKRKKKTPKHHSHRHSARNGGSKREDAREPMARGGSSHSPTDRPPPTAPPEEPQSQPATIVVVVQQPNHPTEPPPSYSESVANDRTTVM